MEADLESINNIMVCDETACARSAASEDENAKVAYDCFFKVIDVFTTDERVEDRGECFSNRELESYYDTVPPQPKEAVRFVLDGRHRRIQLPRDSRKAIADIYPRCSSRLGSNYIHHTPSPNPLYTSPAVISDSFRYHHLPTLRNLVQQNGNPQHWYGMHCFASHIEECPSLFQKLHPLQSTFERSDAYCTTSQDNQGLTTIICYAPDAFATPPDSRWRSYQCANANWRFLKELDGSLQKRRSLSILGNTPERTAQLLLLNIISVNLEQTAVFLDYISSRMDDEDWKILPREFFPLRETRLVDVLGERILVLRTVEDAIAYISSAIECVSTLVRRTYHDQQSSTTSLTRHLEALHQDCDYYQDWSKQLRTKSIEIHEVTVSRFNVKQSSSVSQLTLLAAFFLPLSLAAGVLSMQTRFSDLKLLLFDFVGVVVILATIALVVGIINRYGLDFIKLMIRGRKNRGGGFDASSARYMRVGVLFLWWTAILSSFLVGMLKDVVFGLKVFGFEVVGIVITGWISYGISELALRRRSKIHSSASFL